MSEQLRQPLQLAEAGELDEAVTILNDLLNGEPALPPAARAAALELLGRCELGVLCNIQALMSFSEAEQAYAKCGLPAEAAYCRLMRVRKLLDDRMLREARNQLTPTLREALANGWHDVFSLGLEFLGLLCFHSKELRKAAGLLAEALTRGDQRKLGWESLLVRLSLANCHQALGEREAASKLLAEVCADPRHQKIPRVSAYVLMNQGYDAYVSGDTALARQYFQRVLDLAAPEKRQPKGLNWLYGMASYNLGLLAIEEQDYPAARAALRDVVQLTSHHGFYQLLCGSLTALCVVELLLDLPDEALRHALLCQEYVTQFGDIETRLADYFLAFVFLACGQLDNAQVLWLYKPVLENNSETQLQYVWMQRVLTHLLDKGSGSPYNISVEGLNLARRWLAEVRQSLASTGGQ